MYTKYVQKYAHDFNGNFYGNKKLLFILGKSYSISKYNSKVLKWILIHNQFIFIKLWLFEF